MSIIKQENNIINILIIKAIPNILLVNEISTIKIPVIIGIKIITPIIMVLFIKIKIPPKICNNPTKILNIGVKLKKYHAI